MIKNMSVYLGKDSFIAYSSCKNKFEGKTITVFRIFFEPFFFSNLTKSGLIFYGSITKYLIPYLLFP